jgi:hypothetical protein
MPANLCSAPFGRRPPAGSASAGKRAKTADEQHQFPAFLVGFIVRNAPRRHTRESHALDDRERLAGFLESMSTDLFPCVRAPEWRDFAPCAPSASPCRRALRQRQSPSNQASPVDRAENDERQAARQKHPPSLHLPRLNSLHDCLSNHQTPCVCGIFRDRAMPAMAVTFYAKLCCRQASRVEG